MENMHEKKDAQTGMQSVRVQMVPEVTDRPKDVPEQKMQKPVLEQTENKKHKRRGTVKRICKSCGNTFYEKQNTVDKGYGKYCSRPCVGKDNIATKKCEYCGKEFKIPKTRLETAKCCSTKCKYLLKTIKSLTTYTCKTCGEKFTSKKTDEKNGRGKYCSKKCNAQNLVTVLSGNKSPMWKGGMSFEPYCPKFSRDLKRRIREFFEHRCVICGKHQSELKQKLSCHHVEYNKQACCDGKPVHFATLCRKHHATTNHDRIQWEAMLHRIIDEIYDGKSYYTKEEYAKWGNVNGTSTDTT